MDQLQSTFAVLAMLGCATPISSGCSSILQFAYVCSAIPNFVNHDYLFALLAALAALSGAGSRYSLDAWFGIFRRPPSEPVIVLLKGQLALLYFFAALWKCHPDWIGGHCVRMSFLAMEGENMNRSIPWRHFDEMFGPPMWQALSIGGLCLDAAMFMLTALVKPHMPLLVGSHLMFHGFNACFLGGQIGLRFPFVCIVSVLLFVPGQSCTVVQLKRKASTFMFAKLAFIAWIGLQIALPLRMPLVSYGEYARTGEGYRWSWTMMLHRSTNHLNFGHIVTDTFAVYPYCPGRG